MWNRIKNFSSLSLNITRTNLNLSEEFVYGKFNYDHHNKLKKPHFVFKFEKKDLLFTKNPIISEIPCGSTEDLKLQYIEVLKNRVSKLEIGCVYEIDAYNDRIYMASEASYLSLVLSDKRKSDNPESYYLSRYRDYIYNITDNDELNIIIVETFMTREHVIINLSIRGVLDDFMYKYCNILMPSVNFTEMQFIENKEKLYNEYDISIDHMYPF